MGVREPTRRWTTVHADSGVWNEFERRPGDIVVATPPKSGTTWMQGIATSLVWADGELPAAAIELSPWLDLRRPPELAAATFDKLASQTRRRVIKTHSPADAIPIDGACSYITVYRDVRDVTMSWANHRGAMSPEFVTMLNDLAGDDDATPLDPDWSGDLDILIDELEREFDIATYLESWWRLRDRSNVLFVHYNDLSADLDGEMRRIADFLDVHVADERWDEVVDRCTIDRMRESSREVEGLKMVFANGADSFFHRGTNRRWQGALDEAQLARLDAMTSGLPGEAAEWLEHGSLALGRRP